MALHNKLGEDGEAIAAIYLIDQGYQIVERNWRIGKYEIDIIAYDGADLVIVEVKSRSDDQYAMPEDAITLPKIRRLVRAADAYVKLKDIAVGARFDVVTVIFDTEPPRIDHIVDAFYPPLGR